MPYGTLSGRATIATTDPIAERPIHRQLTMTEQRLELITTQIEQLSSRLDAVLAPIDPMPLARGGTDDGLPKLLASSPVGQRLCNIVDRLSKSADSLSLLLWRLEI